MGISVKTILNQDIIESSNSSVVEKSVSTSRIWVSCVVYKLGSSFLPEHSQEYISGKIVLLIRKFVLKCAESNMPFGQFSSLVLTR